jgi:hypothetical protein
MIEMMQLVISLIWTCVLATKSAQSNHWVHDIPQGDSHDGATKWPSSVTEGPAPPQTGLCLSREIGDLTFRSSKGLSDSSDYFCPFQLDHGTNNTFNTYSII